MKNKRDTSMMTAPRDRWIILERFPDGDGGPKRFEGLWNDEKSWWEDRDGVFRSRVHSWHPIEHNITDQNPKTMKQNAETSADSSSVFIVQERYRGHGATWLDDPDQPPHTERSFELAKDWMILDNAETPGHAIAYDHRIIERRFAILFQTNAERIHGGAETPNLNKTLPAVG